jgi:hypothetical protein
MNCAVPLGSVAATFTLAWPSDKLIAPGQCRLGVASQHKRNAPRHRQYRRSVPTVRDLPSVKVNGIELAYTVAGEVGLPPVVLLHALAEDSSGWSVVVEALVPRYRVYAVDLRGHGGSSRPGDYSLELMRSDVLGFLRALNLEGVSLIGHSLAEQWHAWLRRPNQNGSGTWCWRNHHRLFLLRHRERCRPSLRCRYLLTGGYWTPLPDNGTTLTLHGGRT